MIENRPHAYYIKQRIETYLFNKLFYYFFLKNHPNYHKYLWLKYFADSNDMFAFDKKTLTNRKNTINKANSMMFMYDIKYVYF